MAEVSSGASPFSFAKGVVGSCNQQLQCEVCLAGWEH